MAYTTLIDPDTLAAHLDAPDWAVFDCRFDLAAPESGRREHGAGHVPGARYVHIDEDLSGDITPSSGRHPLPDPVHLAERLGQWGIDDKVQVVAYDDQGGAMAARLWWLLQWLGHDAAAVLDGGFSAWRGAQHPVTDEPTPARRRRRFQMRLRPERVVSTRHLVEDLAGGRYRILDVRAPERFRGEAEPIDPVAGHIPGAVNTPLTDNLDARGRFLSAEMLRRRYEPVIGDHDMTQVAVMCGSGVTACQTLLALEHAGLGAAKLYAGSWSEWIREPERPVERDGEGEKVLSVKF